MNFCLVIATVVLLGACVPYHATYAPALAGQVVNRISNRPVQDAVVSVMAGKANVSTRTDQTGSFRLPALQGWILSPVFSEGSIYFADLRAEAAGFCPVATKVGDFPAFLQGRTDQDPNAVKYQVGSDGTSRVHITLMPRTY